MYTHTRTHTYACRYANQFTFILCFLMEISGVISANK